MPRNDARPPGGRPNRRRSFPLHIQHLEDRTTPSGTHEHVEPEPILSLPPQFFLDNPAGYLTGPQVGDPNALALRFLGDNAATIGLLPGDVANPVRTSGYSDGPGQLTHLYYSQRFNGLEVLNTSIGVHIAADGRVLTTSGGFVPGLAAFDAGPIGIPDPLVSAENAVAAAAAQLGYTLTTPPAITARKAGIDRPTMILDDEVSDLPIAVRLVYVFTGSSGVRPAWEMSLRTPDGEHWYHVGVDTGTGSITFLADWVSHLATYGGFNLPKESPNHGGRTYEVNPADAGASPFGWHDTTGGTGAGYTDTRGNNVFAQEDADSNNIGGPRPDGGSGLLFDFPLNLSAPPASSTDASVVNLFYVNNLLHDIHFRYGFTEAAGNFQEVNYSGAGVGGDALRADALDGSGTNNANMGTPPDGMDPRMQMYRWTSTSPNRDSAFDNGVIAHEFGHGISNRLTGGPANASALNALQSGGMGEGWSDFWAIMLTQTAADQPGDRRGMATYLIGEPTDGDGIRTYPYSFDLSVNPMTFNDFGTGSGQSTQVHWTGARWASVLWDLNWLLIAKYGFDADLSTGYTAGPGPAGAGNKLTLRLVMDGLKLQPANPSFIQARDAILAADRNLTGGVNQREIWTAFARRGLGDGAATASSSSNTLTRSFNLPAVYQNAPGVISQSPAGTSSTVPGSLTIVFSEPMNTTSFDFSDVAAFTGPGGVNLLSSLTGFQWVTSTTLRIDFTPPAPSAREGHYALTLGPNILAADNGAAMDQDLDGTPGEGVQDRYTARFAYDAAPLQVTAVSPSVGSTVNSGPLTIDVTFSEAVLASSLGLDDLQLSQGTVTGVTVLSATQARYTVDGLRDGPVFLSLKHGAVSSPAGFASLGYSLPTAAFTVDTTTAPFPVPLVRVGPLGWSVYEGSVDGSIGTSVDVDSYTVLLDSGTTFSVVAEPDAALRPTVEVLDPQGNLIGSNSAAAAGIPAVLNSLGATTTGVYTVRVLGVSPSTGKYTLRLTMDAAAETESTGGSSNNASGQAQPLDPSFFGLGNSASVASVLGVGDYASDALPNEVEGNGTTGSANDATRNFVPGAGANLYQLTLSGNVTSSDSDWFRIGALQPGDVLTAMLGGSTTGEGTLNDSYLELWRAGGGTPVFEGADDDGGPGLQSLFHRRTISAADTYYVRVRGFSSTDVGTYRLGLFLENAGPVPSTGGNVTSETESNNTLGTANDASGSWRQTAATSRTAAAITAGDTDVFRYSFTAGDRVTVRALDAAGTFRPRVTLLNGSGATLASDNGSSNGAPLAGVYSYLIPATGTYFVSVSAAAGTGTYTLDVSLAGAAPPAGTPAFDYFTLTLAPQQPVSFAVQTLTAGVVGLDLLDSGGSVVATAAPGAANFDLGFLGFPAPSAGTYFLRVASVAPTEYLLTAVRSGTLDREANDAPGAAQPMFGAAVGAVGFVGDSDWYTFDVTSTSGYIVARTTTPGGGAGEFINLLDPRLELYRPDGTLLAADDNSGPDGRNASIVITPPETGTYRLRVLGSGGTTGEYTATAAVVTNGPPANVSAGGPYTVDEGGSVSLAGSATDPEGDPLVFSWDVNGDGVFGDVTGQNPSVSWSTLQSLGLGDGPKVAAVRVRVTDGTNVVDSPATTLTVRNVGPTATFTGGTTVSEGSTGTVTFSSPADKSAADEAAGFRYAYDFDNDGKFDLGGATYATASKDASVTVPASFLDDGPGTVTVRGRIFDKDDGFSDYTTTFTLTNVAPTGTLTGNPTVAEGTAGLLSFPTPFDPSQADRTAGLHFAFDFDGDGVWDVGDGTYKGSPNTPSVAIPAKYLADGPGTLTSKAVIIDKDGGASQVFSFTTTVENVAPTALLSNTGPVYEGGTVSVVFTNQSDVLADLAAGLRYAYDFGNDGTFDLGTGTYSGGVAASSVVVPPELLDGTGFYVVRAVVIDKDNGARTFFTTITVNGKGPTATFTNGGPVDEAAGTTFVRFTNQDDPSAADRAAGFRYAYDFNYDGVWDLGDGSYAGSTTAATATVPPELLADGPGPRVVRAWIIDKDGNYTQYLTSIVVNNLPPTATLTNGGSVYEGQSGKVSFSDQDDPSPADVAAGFRYAYDFDNDGTFDLGNGTYAGSVTSASVTVPAGYLADGPGPSVVRARIIDKDNGWTDYTTTITVLNAAPTASLTSNGPVPEGGTGTVTFADQSDAAADLAAGLRYAYDFDGDGVWDLGDGTYAGSVSQPSATLPAEATADGPATITVRARVIDKDGDFSEYTTQIVVTSVAPYGTLVNTGPVRVGEVVWVGFVNPVTDPSTTDKSVGFTFSFDFNNDGDFTDAGDVLDGTEPFAGYVYDAAGTYPVRVRVTDKDGAFTDHVSQVRVLADSDPVGSLTNSGPVVEGGTATVTVVMPSGNTRVAGLRYSYDFDGDGVWDLGDGTYAGSVATTTATVPAALTADGPVTRVVRVRVFELGSPNSDLTTAITVVSAPPTALLTGPTGPVNRGQPVVIAFGPAFDPSGPDTAAGFRYSFDLNNDGDFTDAGEVADGSSPQVTATFSEPGTYTVRGRIADKNGAFTESAVTITVRGQLPWVAIGTDVGGDPVARLVDASGGEQFSARVFDPSFRGGVRVAAGDVNGDGITDLVVGTGPGTRTLVRVLDGKTGAELYSLTPFEESFTGGVYVTAGDVNGDGYAEFAITPDQGGGPRVRIFDGKTGGQIADFFGIEDVAFRGGARASIADLTGDGTGDLLVAAGFRGGPRVAGFDGRTLGSDRPVKLFADFFVFELTLRNGVFVTGGDLNGDGFAEVIAGGGPGGGPRVHALDGAALLRGETVQAANFFAGDPTSRGGVRITVTDLDGDDRDDLVVGAGTGSRVTAYLGKTITPNDTPPEEFALDALPGLGNGVFVG